MVVVPEDLEILRREARYRRERYDLLRAKAYGGRLVVPARVAELERAALGAESRLKRAEARARSEAPVSEPTPKGEADAKS
jgi:hypothetical protein